MWRTVEVNLSTDGPKKKLLLSVVGTKEVSDELDQLRIDHGFVTKYLDHFRQQVKVRVQ